MDKTALQDIIGKFRSKITTHENSKESQLKNKAKRVFAATLATGVILGSMSGCYARNSAKGQESIKVEQSVETAVKLSSQAQVNVLAKKYDVENLLTTDNNGNYVRFEAMQGKPIDVIVDEHSYWSTTDANLQGVKIAVNELNKLFVVINPDMQFRYISREDYEKNVTNNPCIFVTSELKIASSNGTARAITSPMKSSNIHTSPYGNSVVVDNAKTILSSTGMINLNAEAQGSIILHEFFHALGFEGHVDEQNSIMNPYGKDAAILSYKPSADAMYAMMSLYYNPQVNTNSIEDVNKYIEKVDSERLSEIECNQSQGITNIVSFQQPFESEDEMEK